MKCSFTFKLSFLCQEKEDRSVAVSFLLLLCSFSIRMKSTSMHLVIGKTQRQKCMQCFESNPQSCTSFCPAAPQFTAEIAVKTLRIENIFPRQYKYMQIYQRRALRAGKSFTAAARQR